MPILILILLAGVASGEEVSDPSKTNLLLRNFSTPQLTPGESGTFSFDVYNPYNWSMDGTTLDVEIYEFSSSMGSKQVQDIEGAPVFLRSGKTSVRLSLGTLASGAVATTELIIKTASDTPHGSVFTQGSYFVRFRLEFDYLGDEHAIMVSPRGFFSKDELTYALLREPTPEERVTYRYVGNANYTYLGQLLGLESIDGLIPDTAFGVKERLPRWPFYLLLGGAVAASILSFYHYRVERRGDYKPINRGQR